MQAEEILANAAHRQEAFPTENWKIYQEWNRVVFLHWKVDVAVLRPHVPAGMQIDLHEGEAWVSVVAFTMESVHPHHWPTFKPISDFDEVNIRTYVTHNKQKGVYFLSIEAGSHLSAFLAKQISGLKYRYSSMTRSTTRYSSENEQFGDTLNFSFGVGDKMSTKSALDIFLTERYMVLDAQEDEVLQFQVHHPEWPIYECNLMKLSVKYPRYEEMIGGPCDAVHYSPGVAVVSWNPTAV